MGLLTEYPTREDKKFDKEKIINEIKEGLEKDFPDWSWLTTPDYEFDLILIRNKMVREEIVNTQNPMSKYEKVEDKRYQIAYGVFVAQDQDEVFSQDCAVIHIKIESARQIFNILGNND